MGGTDRKFYSRKRGGEVMNDILTDLLAVIGVVLNGLPQGLLALAYGFASVPTALAFLVGVVGNLATQSVAPISFQAETITYAGTAGKNRSERCTMIFIGGAIMTVIGLFGLLTKIVDFVGEDVAYGMMAGVGIILTKAAIDMIRNDGIAGGVSLVAALITYFSPRTVPTHWFTPSSSPWWLPASPAPFSRKTRQTLLWKTTNLSGRNSPSIPA